ncbi:hypothetical protein SAMN05660895_0991 [Thermoflavifilum thermophilum]|uniref:Uncharacterized protein n=1 Tax=Thermoflavifilum thermophilum TaxID=1393122 RepID=A0A1I7N8Y5_9BACT|nr:hypothetical protein SAMN05660895_0991 [Thermoflavifilum thermophilum]
MNYFLKLLQIFPDLIKYSQSGGFVRWISMSLWQIFVEKMVKFMEIRLSESFLNNRFVQLNI